MSKNNKKLKLSRCRVFFDFDNTIVPFDVLDDIVKRFSKDKEWMRFERDWKNGKIGSRECLRGQMKSVKVDKKEFFSYLSKIKVDPYFPKLLKLLRKSSVAPVILSDSFSFVIEFILKNNGIKNIKLYSNRLKFYKDRLKPAFPHKHKSCFTCAHCKKNSMLKSINNGNLVVYVGDGRSDICPAKTADLVFAKGSLLKHFKKNKRECVAIKDLSGVYNYFKGRAR